MDRQFKDLFVAPLQSMVLVGPILIVIQGLDLCRDHASFVDALAQHIDQIPPNVRILLTAEAGSQIPGRFVA